MEVFKKNVAAMSAANRAMREAQAMQALVDSDIVTLNDRITALASRVSTLENNYTTLAARVKALEDAQ